MLKQIFIQIPVFNEEKTIIHVVNEMPQALNGFGVLKVLVIDDGSTDRTLEHVRGCGIEHVLAFKKNQGLGIAFNRGLAYCLAQGADVIINTDGDGQYSSDQIERIAAPILSGQADCVIGDRQLSTIVKYPKYKLISQSLGNSFLSFLFKHPVRDATSGFRAMNREAAQLLVEKLENKYTYTVESLSLLLKRRMRVKFVPINIRYPTRPSRLIKSKQKYVLHFVLTALKMRFAR